MKKILLFICCLFAQCAWANAIGTVIKVKGEAKIQLNGSHKWIQIQGGNKIQTGDKIKTANNAKLRILNIDGSIIRIKGKKELLYTGNKKNTLKEGGWDTVLMELKSKRSRKVAAVTRGAGGGETIQDIWMRLMKQPLTEEYEEDILILSSWYEREQKYNRQRALLWKLGNIPSYEMLKIPVSKEYPNRFHWRVDKFIHGHQSEAKSEDSLSEGDQVQILFLPEKESYFYLFLTTQPQGKPIETAALYPSSLEAVKVEKNTHYYEARVKGGVEQRTPKYTLDDSVGNEHIWGWSCSGPIVDHSITQQAINAVAKYISTSTPLTSRAIAESAPSICTPFALSLRHQ